VTLAKALLARAEADADFKQGLATWWGQASLVYTDEGNVTNTISGGNQHVSRLGPAKQAGG
jgi:hypothetical protein